MADKQEKEQPTEAATNNQSDDTTVDVDDSSVKVEIHKNEDETPADSTATQTEEEQLRARVSELEDKLLRTAAEFENRKKRLDRQNEELIRMANDRLIGQLLDVVDNFQRALDHGDDNKDSFRQGIELIFSQLQEFLGKYDIKPIEAIGQRFDPSVHEALMQIDSEEYDEGIVALEVSRGYKAGDRVIRYAKVGVSKGTASHGDAADAKTQSDSEDNN